jgi:hypothetical protein
MQITQIMEKYIILRNIKHILIALRKKSVKASDFEKYHSSFLVVCYILGIEVDSLTTFIQIVSHFTLAANSVHRMLT